MTTEEYHIDTINEKHLSALNREPLLSHLNKYRHQLSTEFCEKFAQHLNNVKSFEEEDNPNTMKNFQQSDIDKKFDECAKVLDHTIDKYIENIHQIDDESSLNLLIYAIYMYGMITDISNNNLNKGACVSFLNELENEIELI